MKRKIICSLIIFLSISLASLDAFAKSYAWLIDNMESKAYKL